MSEMGQQLPVAPKETYEETHETQVFRLYVSAASPVSSRAIVNVRRFFERYLPGEHRLSVLEISENVGLARADQIYASPTLIRVSPLPHRRFIGAITESEKLRVALGLADQPAQ